jgi:hypothetical protein
VRTVKTAVGATAVQIVCFSGVKRPRSTISYPAHLGAALAASQAWSSAFFFR